MLQTDLTATTVSMAPALAAVPRNTFTLIGTDSPERRSLEERVRTGFGFHFGAAIHGFMPQLALYRHHTGREGVIGVRSAADQPLFLEHYLDAPIQLMIAEASGQAVSRSRIAEVGQFVVDDRDIVGSFFRDLVPFLRREGFDWVCFTGTNRIRAILKRVGLNGLAVATAAADRAAPTGDHWGNYYDHEPIVIVGKLDDPRGRWCEPALALANPAAAVA
jgi:hypothetical protein